MDERTDEEIVSQVQHGDSHSFGILVERYMPKMKRYAQKFLFGYEDAEDLAQEIFIKAYINIQGFDVSRRFSPWLYRIAHNEFINTIKKKGKEALPFFDPDTIFPHPIAPERTDDDAYKREIKEIMDKCLVQLAPKYREALILYYYEDMDYREMAEILHVPVSTIGVRLKRGREALQKICHDLNIKK
jgi:RNA polymerase sigma-70 factor, ECF subfamily